MCRVKLPKTFLAVNLSEAFDFEENDKLFADNVPLEMKAPVHEEPIVLNMTEAAPVINGETDLIEGGETLKTELESAQRA